MSKNKGFTIAINIKARIKVGKTNRQTYNFLSVTKTLGFVIAVCCYEIHFSRILPRVLAKVIVIIITLFPILKYAD